MTIHRIDIDGERIAIKESKSKLFGRSFRVVKPLKNEDGSLNWFNLLTGGSWINLIITILVIAIITAAIKEYSSNMNTLLDCFRVPGQLPICVDTFGSPEANLINNLVP